MVNKLLRNKFSFKIVRILLLIIIKTPLIKLVRWKNKKNILILLYHGVSNSEDSKHVHISSFDKQISYIKKNYEVISLEEFSNILENKKPIKNNLAIITFDDGYYNNYLYALPILKKNNLPANIFLSTFYLNKKRFIWLDEIEFILNSIIDSRNLLEFNFKGKNYSFNNKLDFQNFKNELKKGSVEEINKLVIFLRYKYKLKVISKDIEEYSLLDFSQINEMKKNNIYFYSHGHTHQILSKLDNNRLFFEINSSIKYLKKNNINLNPNFFAYPNGKYSDFDDRSRKILSELNVKYALTNIPGHVSLRTNHYSINRISVDTNNFNSFLIRIYFNLFL